MFYDEHEINNTLNCPMCEIRYEEPKQLPCGQIICNYCVAKLDIQRIQLFFLFKKSSNSNRKLSNM